MKTVLPSLSAAVLLLATSFAMAQSAPAPQPPPPLPPRAPDTTIAPAPGQTTAPKGTRIPLPAPAVSDHCISEDVIS